MMTAAKPTAHTALFTLFWRVHCAAEDMLQGVEVSDTDPGEIWVCSDGYAFQWCLLSGARGVVAN